MISLYCYVRQHFQSFHHRGKQSVSTSTGSGRRKMSKAKTVRNTLLCGWLHVPDLQANQEKHRTREEHGDAEYRCLEHVRGSFWQRGGLCPRSEDEVCVHARGGVF